MTDQADKIADILIDLRRAAAVRDELPAEIRPSTLEQAYRAQDRFRERWAQKVVAWKAGATAAAVQARFGLNAPFAGPVFEADRYTSPARLPAARFPHLALESEFAFRLGTDLAPKPSGWSRSEVLSAVDALVPAIEVVGPRFSSLLFAQVHTAIADCGLNAALVLGEPIATFDADALASHKVRLIVDGEVRGEGSGANVLGDPVKALVWTVNALGERGIALAAGQVISTGTTTGIVYVAPDQTAVADFGALGRVELRFDGPASPHAVKPPA